MSTLPLSNRPDLARSIPKPRIPALAQVDDQVINVANQEDAIRFCMRSLRAGRGFTLFTLNLDHLVTLRSDPSFRAVYARATFVTADGAPVARLARRSYAHVERTTGADLVTPLAGAAAFERLPVYLFGASEATLNKAAEKLKQQYPNLIIAGMEAPPRGFDPMGEAADLAADRIARSGARICFVALGAPKQEFFGDRMAQRHPHIGWLGIGAALDFIAGEKSRAPRLLQRIGLEWFWRLMQEPRRLGLRYLRCAMLLARLSLHHEEAPVAPARIAR
ncbi:WecB/TagA/CpsF family glycosyltransferase [Terrarubrum flagellatum]|uniref:WecB/TagA/CpsF family glycosyltransferase n=1 Tax=Terrirubrum flagellatum TaxID=2895980 RepID=UPI003144F1E5